MSLRAYLREVITVRFVGFIFACLIPVVAMKTGEVRADDEFFPYIDTHTHMEFRGKYQVESALSGAHALIAEMDRLKIEMSILMPLPQGVGPELRPGFDYPDLLPVLQAYPDRVRLSAGPGILGPLYLSGIHQTPTKEELQTFKNRAEQVAQLPFISGFGEFAIVHLSIPALGDNHPYESVQADHPMLLALADIAAEHHLPIDVHMDLAPSDMPVPDRLMNPNAWDPNPAILKKNVDSFERLLAHNRGAKIVWAHVGAEPLMTRTVEICRQLLTRNPNLYMSFRLQVPNPAAWRLEAGAMRPSGDIKPAWLALIKEFPDRFLVGSDTFYTDKTESRAGSAEGRMNLHRFLTHLPPDIARMIAHDNVYRIYRMDVQIPPAGSVVAAPVFAPTGARIEFNAYDLNQDGTITIDEFVKARRKRFLKAGETDQGSLARDPYLVTYPPKMKAAEKLALFKQADGNGDGKISSDEFDAGSRQLFEALDKTQSGRLTPANLEEAAPKAAASPGF